MVIKMKTDKQKFIELKDTDTERFHGNLQKGTKDMISKKVGRNNLSKYFRELAYKDLFSK